MKFLEVKMIKIKLNLKESFALKIVEQNFVKPNLARLVLEETVNLRLKVALTLKQ